MPKPDTILIIDANSANRTALAQILSEEYCTLQAGTGASALALLDEHAGELSAVMLDIVMPELDGFGFLNFLHRNPRYQNLPTIVTTGSDDSEDEIKALKLGAWDLVAKPFNAEIIRFRLRNAIERSQLTAFNQLKYLAEYDTLTGIFNKSKFFSATRKLLDEKSEEQYVIMRFDIDRFQLVNSFFGTDEGDRLLIYIASCIQKIAATFARATYGRMESDIFCFCMPYNEANTGSMVQQSKKLLTEYNPSYDMVPSIGIYVIDDNSLSVEEMYNRATLAAKTCKGNYIDYYAFYNEGMSVVLTREQEIVNEMSMALEKEEFVIYLQPKYNIQNNLPCGAEALVRWLHPQKGLLAPGEFIPVFERNGFITKLDHYVWERTCRYLRSMLDKGLHMHPISVNVSRVNLYNPQLAEQLITLVEQYDLDPSMLNLELTESAYTDNPIAMGETIAHLQSYGFTIMMDDFGNGYSSLNILKDIPVDVLKIDMRFLSKSKIPGRGENIIASVVRMAKWLNIPAIAEGVETIEQVGFLRSVGCDYVQGFYFARPMPTDEYEKLCLDQATLPKIATERENYRYDDLFSSNPEMENLLDSTLQAAALYEVSADDSIELIRVNEAYYSLLGFNDMARGTHGISALVDEAFRQTLLNTFDTCVRTQCPAEYEYRRNRGDGGALWIHTKLTYVSEIGGKHIVIGTLTDVTIKKEIDAEMQKYRASLLSHQPEAHTLLIVDDSEFNRTILKNIFKGQYHFLEAVNGREALEILRQNKNDIDLILLDIVMPEMDGKEFLRHKKAAHELDSIPVIMITSDDSAEQQVNTLALGANDYIVKPFVPEVVARRVKNVLAFNRRFQEMVREYSSMSEQSKTDQTTGLMNRISAGTIIGQRLKSAPAPNAMFLIHIDNLKEIDDTRGHLYGDKVLYAAAQKLRTLTRPNHLLARMSGNEFAVFMESIPSEALMEQEARELCYAMCTLLINEKEVQITCSLGIAIATEDDTFEQLYQNAGKALYNAQYRGKGSTSVFGREPEPMARWIDDASGILNVLHDAVYVCDMENYELLYANDFVYQFLNVTRSACAGKKCYEVLVNRTEPCPQCSVKLIKLESVYTRLFQFENMSKALLMRGKEINWNGRPAHLEIAVDITKVENIREYLQSLENQ